MLINISNHRSEEWCQKQIKAAVEIYGEIKDIRFPKVPPEADYDEIEKLSIEYLTIILNELVKTNDKINAVHLMGEFSFVYSLLTRLKSRGIKAIASTSERNVHINGNGDKVSKFNFVKFREFYRI